MEAEHNPASKVGVASFSPISWLPKVAVWGRARFPVKIPGGWEAMQIMSWLCLTLIEHLYASRWSLWTSISLFWGSWLRSQLWILPTLSTQCTRSRKILVNKYDINSCDLLSTDMLRIFHALFHWVWSRGLSLVVWSHLQLPVAGCTSTTGQSQILDPSENPRISGPVLSNSKSHPGFIQTL